MSELAITRKRIRVENQAHFHILYQTLFSLGKYQISSVKKEISQTRRLSVVEQTSN